jgi:hypothetical protein
MYNALTDVQQAKQLNKLLKLEDDNARGHNQLNPGECYPREDNQG